MPLLGCTNKACILSCSLSNFDELSQDPSTVLIISALILAPTRELCLQIHDLALKLARRFPYIVPGHVMGGENRGKEKARLRKGKQQLLVCFPEARSALDLSLPGIVQVSAC